MTTSEASALWSTLFIGLVWYFFQAITTSDLPLLSEKKSGDGDDCASNFSLVWYGLLYKQWRPLTYLSSVRRRAWMASIDLVWFGLVWYFLQAMTTSDLPLLGEKKSMDGEHWFGLVCFGMVFSPSNDDLWLTSPRWEEEQGWRGLWSTLFIGLV